MMSVILEKIINIKQLLDLKRHFINNSSDYSSNDEDHLKIYDEIEIELALIKEDLKEILDLDKK